MAQQIDQLDLDRQLTIGLSTDEHALLAEAMALTNERDPKDVLRVALQQLVERQRFLNWVAAHEKNTGTG